MYFRLDMGNSTENTFVKATTHKHVLLTNGQRLPDDMPTPFEFSMEVDEDEDKYDEQNDVVVYETPNMFSYYRNCSLMHKDMVDSIVGAGADNLQTFPAVIKHLESDLEFNDYLVVNIIGMVSCANVAESETDPLGPSYFFHNLVIDSSKIHDFLVFRLAEYSFEVIVHERIAQALMSKELNGLVLEPLSTSPSK